MFDMDVLRRWVFSSSLSFVHECFYIGTIHFIVFSYVTSLRASVKYDSAVFIQLSISTLKSVWDSDNAIGFSVFLVWSIRNSWDKADNLRKSAWVNTSLKIFLVIRSFHCYVIKLCFCMLSILICFESDLFVYLRTITCMWYMLWGKLSSYILNVTPNALWTQCFVKCNA